MSIFGSSTEVADREARNKIYGVVIGIVVDNADTKNNTYRVKLRFPWLEDGGESDQPQEKTWWARIASFLAGEYVGDDNSMGPRGAYFMPEIGDEVLVAFEHGDISRPIVVGRMWSDVAPTGGGGAGKPNHPIYAHTSPGGKLVVGPDGDGDTPHGKTAHAKGKNDLSGIRTRAGNVLAFNDHAGEAAIYLRTPQKHRIELVDGGKQGVIIADTNGNHVWLKSGSSSGDIEIVSEGTISLKAKKDITLEAMGKITTKSGGLTKMESGATFDVNATGAMTLKTSASGKIQAGAELKLTAPHINLN